MPSALLSGEPIPSRTNLILALTIGLMAMVFLIDLQLPLGVAGGVPYVAIVLLTLWLPSSFSTWVFAGLCSALTLLGLWGSPSGGEWWKVVANRSLALFAIWTIAVLSIKYKQYLFHMQREDFAFRSMMDLMPQMVFAKDAKGRILAANQAARTFLGWGQGESQVEGRYSYYPSTEDECLARERDGVLLSGASALTADTETYRNFNGELRQFNTNKFSFVWPETGETVLATVAVDETERLEQMEKLKLADQVIESSPDHISIVGKDYRYRRVNPAYERAHGRAQQDIVRLHIQDLVGTDVFHNVVKPQFDQCLQGQDIHYEDWFSFGQQGRRYMAVSYSPLKDEAGQIDAVVVISRDLTERHLSDESLAYQASLLSAVVDSSLDAIFVKDLSGKYLMVNPAGCEMVGRSQNQIVGNTDMEVFGQEIGAAVMQVDQQVMQEGTATRLEETLTLHGQWKAFSTMKAPLKNTRGNVSGVIGVARDITQRKHDQEELLQSEYRYRSLIEAAGNVIIGLDCHGHITEWNREAERLYGKPCEEVLGKNYVEIFVPQEEREGVTADIQKVLGGEPTRDFENHIQSPDGVLRDTLWNVDRLVDNDRNPIGIIAIGRDITDRNAIEAALHKNEARLQHLLTASPAVIYTCLPSGNFPCTFVSQNITWQLGYESREFVEDSNFWVDRIHPEDVQRVMAGLPDVLEWDRHVHEYRFLHKDGSYRWMHDELLMVRDKDGNPLELVGSWVDTTERKQAEEALQESQALLQTILDNSPGLIFLKDLNGRYLHVNQQFKKVFTVTEEKVIGRTDDEVFSPDQASQFQAHDRQVRESRKLLEFEEVARHDDGPHTSIVHKFPLFNEKNEMFAIGGITTDITPRKQSEEALAKTQQAYEDLVNSVEGIVWECEFPSYRFTFVSQQAERLLGYPVQQWLTESGFFGSLLHADDRDWALRYCLDETTCKRDHELEYRMIASDGGVVWLRDLVTVVVENDQPVKVRGVMVDITEHKKAEEALQSSEFTLKSFFASAPFMMGISEIERDDIRHISGNPATARFFGVEQAAMHNRLASEMGMPLDHLRLWIERARESQQTLHPIRFEYQHQHPESLRWLSATVACLGSDFPDFCRFAYVVEDITERRRLEEEICQYNEELESEVAKRTQRIQELEQRRMQVEKLAALAQVAAGVAHEINNPLASIGQSLEVLKRAIPVTHPRYKFIGKIHDSVDRMAHIVRQLYQLYRPDSKALNPVEIHEILRLAIEIMKDSAKKHGVSLVEDVPEHLPSARVSRNSVTQILCNIIQNALDVSPPKGVVQVSVEEHSDFVVVLVTDEGPGISSEIAPHIFDPFFTTKEGTSLEGGMGLGLAVSYRLIESCGGSIDFSTELGQGATFRVTIPLEKRS